MFILSLYHLLVYYYLTLMNICAAYLSITVKYVKNIIIRVQYFDTYLSDLIHDRTLYVFCKPLECFIY